MNLSALIFMVSLMMAAQVEDDALTGRVTAVHSGDTLSLVIEDELFKARLVDVDAPELKQPFGPQARRMIYDLVYDQNVRVEVEGVDKNKVVLCRIVLQDGRVLNDELLAAGLGWHYRVRPQLSERMMRLEYFAFTHSMGLWMQKNPIPPWEFRREKHIPDAPVSAKQVDYDRILHYGMIGDRKSMKYQWPACEHYGRWRPAQPVTLSNMVEAENMGFLPSKGCP